MKKLIVLILLVVVGVYAASFIMLSESNAKKTLDEMDALLIEGKGEELCAYLHDDVQVSATSNMGGQTSSINGGKDVFCDYMKQAGGAMAMMKGQMEIKVERSNFKTERNWLKPWTASYTYDENTSISIPSAGANMSNESKGGLTLIMTFGGVKVLKATSEPAAGA
jgi:hypothetical protein